MRVRFPVLACMRESLSGVVELALADRPRAFVRDGAEVLDPLVRSVGGLGLGYGASGAAERPSGRAANVTLRPFSDPSPRLPPAATFWTMTFMHPKAELPPTGRQAIDVPDPCPAPCALPTT